MSPNRAKHQAANAKARAIRQELAQLHAKKGTTPRKRTVTIDDICWMARKEELMPQSIVALDSPLLSSTLYGPCMRTTQMERIEVIELDEDGREIWSA